MSSGYSVLLAGVLFMLAVVVFQADAGCNKCCQGKDNKCRSYGPRISKRNATTCFCDESCAILGDCCLDYSSVCKPRDCVVEDYWSQWSECSERCGWGYKSRSKKVMRKPENGGKSCGPTAQKAFCLGIKCKGVRRKAHGYQELKETGKIIPATFGSWRKNKLYNPFNDIRSNLFKHYSKDKVIKRPSYCAKFEIVETRDACQTPRSGNWAQTLQKGQTICVECQPSAMKRGLGVRCKGQGVLLRETRWNAVTVPGCHGKWTMTTEREDCSCNPQQSNSFIFI